MKTLIVSLLLASAALAQTAPAAPSSGATAVAINLPTYIAGGAAYNQLAGWNLWFSAIVPVVNQTGIYESTTTDIFPTKSVVAGKTVYTFQTSIRQGIHKVFYSDPKNTVLIGGDAGVAFSQASTSSTGTTTGASGSFTATYVRQLNAHIAIAVPVRALYMPNLGWNPVVEVGLVFKP